MQETETRYIKPEFIIVANKPLTLRCAYCEHEVYPSYIASSKWHQGITENKRYHNADSSMLGRIQPENLIIFDSKDEAFDAARELGAQMAKVLKKEER